MVERGVPAHAPARILPARAQLGLQQPRRGAGRKVQRGALGAQPAGIGRVGGVAAHARDARAVGLYDYAAADPAIAAGRAALLVFETPDHNHAFLHASRKHRDAHAGVLQALTGRQAEVLLVDRGGDDQLALEVPYDAARQHVRARERVVVADRVDAVVIQPEDRDL